MFVSDADGEEAHSILFTISEKLKSMLQFRRKKLFKNCHCICVKASRACLVVWVDCFLSSTD